MTDDGYYGIVVAENEILLGNGCQEIMDPDQFALVVPMVLNVYQPTGCHSNFAQLLDYLQSTMTREQLTR